MDESSALPPENWKLINRQPQHTGSHTARTDEGSSFRPTGEQFVGRPPSASTSAARFDMPLILAPTPRRHLIDNSASQHWLRGSYFSPPSSRPLSSTSQASQQDDDWNGSGSDTTHSPDKISTSSKNPQPITSPSFRPVLPNTVRRRIISSSVSLQSRNIHEFFESKQSQTQGKNKEIAHLSDSTDTHEGRPFRHFERRRNPGQAEGLLHLGTPETMESAMGRRWLRWMHKRGLKQWVLPGLVGASTLVKLLIGLGPYSGHATPPMYGDYEAQRHWMEITKHLPFRRWYSYDLQYWGLDYPPLTAYISWLCGIVAHWINPSWVALNDSRGLESAESKLFMRFSVLVLDSLIYIPAIIMFSRTWQRSRSKRTQEFAILTLLLQPALLLIDFGHFQYNSVMLGFALLSINFFAIGNDILGAFFFVLSLGFKQMALYYAPAIGSYLLAKCLHLGIIKGGRLFLRLAVITLSTSIILFLPWLPPFAPFSSITQPVIRIFPFARGLFEDKVANLWCATNVVVKWKSRMSSGSLVKLSTLFTAIGFLPSVIGLLRAGVTMSPASAENRRIDSKIKSTPQKLNVSRDTTPFLPLLPYALLTSSISFFLFSFQVHEKTILLPLLPMTLLLSGANIDSTVYQWGVLFNNVAVFSMWPLLKKDGLGVQYIAAVVLWNRLVGFNPFGLHQKFFVQFVSTGVHMAMVTLHILELVVHPPSRYPDLYPVLNVLISTPVFLLVWLWSIKSGVEVGWAIGGLGRSNSDEQIQEVSKGTMSVSGSGTPHIIVRSGSSGR